MARYGKSRRQSRRQKNARKLRQLEEVAPSIPAGRRALIYRGRGAAALATGGASEVARAGVKAVIARTKKRPWWRR